MALVQNTLIGKASGSVGNATFAGWKGLQVLKSKSTNSYSNPTPVQLENNSKFATIVIFARSIMLLITAGFKAGAVGKSEYNVFTQENPYSQVVTGSPGNYKVDTQLIKISRGPEFQTPLYGISKSQNGANVIQVGWTATSAILDTSPVYIAAFDRTSGTYVTSVFTPYGDEGVSLTSTALGTNIANTDIYAFYVNPNTGKACDSILVPA